MATSAKKDIYVLLFSTTKIVNVSKNCELGATDLFSSMEIGHSVGVIKSSLPLKSINIDFNTVPVAGASMRTETNNVVYVY